MAGLKYPLLYHGHKPVFKFLADGYLLICNINMVVLVFSYWLLYFTTAKASILVNAFEVRLHMMIVIYYLEQQANADQSITNT